MASASADQSCGQLVGVGPVSASVVGQGPAVGDAANLASLIPSEPKVECSIGCGTRLPVSEMFRSNARAAPECHPCRNAKKAMTNAASKDPVQKEALAKLRKEDPELFHAKIRNCRIEDSSAASKAKRRSACQTLLTTLEQTVGVEESGGLLWLKRSQWVAFHKLWEAMDEEAAARDFDRRAKHVNTVKMQLPGDEPRISVMDIPRTTAFRKREFSVAVGGQQRIDSKEEADDALQKLASVGVGAETLSTKMFGQFAGHLRPGVAAGSSSGQLMPMDETAAPVTAMVIPDSHFEGPAPKRKLSEKISDPDEPLGQPKKTKRCKSALSGVTGELRALRSRGIEASQSIWEKFGKAGKNVAKKLVASAKSGKVPLSPAEEDLVNTYEKTLASAKAVEKEVSGWTLDSAASKLEECANFATILEECYAHLTKCIGQLVERKDERRKVTNQLRADEQKLRAARTKDYRTGVPWNLLHYLYDQNALVVRPQIGQPGVAEQETTKLTDRFAVVSSGEVGLKEDTPVYFPVAESGVGQQVQELPLHIGAERVASATKECAQSMSNSGVDTSFKRLQPRGQPADTLQQLDWIPEDWKAKRATPEHLCGMASPTLMVSRPGSCRYGPEEWPLTGLGQFLTVCKGSVTLVIWPAKSLLDVGCDLANQWHFIFEEMLASAFNVWASEHLQFVCMSEGSAA